ncbi:MAG: alkaline phosphatase D family protein [Flavisolibacter sp.]
MIKNLIGLASIMTILFCKQTSAQNEVIYIWSGAITSTSAKVNVKLTTSTTTARLVISTSSSLTSPVYGPFATASSSNNMMAAMSIDGLSANTKYYYAIEADGVVDNSVDDIGSFKTTGGLTYSYKFAVGSCGLNSNHIVYNKIKEKDPLFFLVSGDFHYSNPNSADINVHRNAYETNMLSQTATRNLFIDVPLSYVWDDHDYSGNDSDSIAIGKSNARMAYQEYVPHYPLAAGSGNVPIYQAFSVGRIHFILTDLRSTRRQGVSIWNPVQKQWFKDQCLWAKNNNLTIAWVSSVSFGGTQADNWGGFAAERTEISNFFRDNGIQYMFILSGDAHMLSMDNGANHDFSTGANNPFDYPVFASAALNQTGSNKGGNYNVRPDGTVDPAPGANYIYTNPSNTFGQYGIVDVSDNGTLLSITFTGYRVTSAGVETQLSTFNFSRATGNPLPIKLKSFTAKAINEKVQLNWEVSEQTNCDKYIVEKSTDGINFTSLAEVNCKLSDKYTLIDDKTVTGNNYYRLKMVETNGQYKYSDVSKVMIASKPMSLMILSVPTKSNVKFRLNNSPSSEKAFYYVYDLTGKKRAEGILDIPSGLKDFNISLPTAEAGSYLLKIYINQTSLMQKFIIQ